MSIKSQHLPARRTAQDEKKNASFHREAEDFVVLRDALPGHLIRRLQQIAVSVFLEHLERADCDLTPVQYAALMAARQYPDIDQASLAGVIAYDRATIGGVIDRLDKKGLLTRRRSISDRRSFEVNITAVGRKLLDRIEAAVQAAQAEMLAPLNAEERAIFMLLLRKLVLSGNERSRAPHRPMTGSDGAD